MKLSRKLTDRIRFLLDQMLPPFIRDSRWFMAPLIRIIYKEGTKDILSFKERAPLLTEAEYRQVYENVLPYNIERETDCNDESIKDILRNIIGSTVLDAACGRGYLAAKIAQNSKLSVSGADIVIEQRIRDQYPYIKFVEAFVEKLPFEDGTFDTVICTHCIEHVTNISACMSELRRVAKRRLIVVVPKQRPYKYTFDLHLNFFPYIHSFLIAVASKESPLKKENITCFLSGSDIYYQEEK